MGKKRRQKTVKRPPLPKLEGHGYDLRRRSLEYLGFQSYADYLASELWANIRFRVIRLAHGNCKSCWRKATQVHHRHYALAVMAGQDISSLVALCQVCHKNAEFDDQRKVGLGTANQRLARQIHTHKHADSLSVSSQNGG